MKHRDHDDPSGYVKSVAADAFRVQVAAGRGVQGAKLRDEDFVQQIVHTTTHAYLLLFSNLGRVFRLRGSRDPMKERTAKGTAIVNLLNLQPNESIQAIVTTDDFRRTIPGLATANGTVKKTASASTTSHAARDGSPSTCARATKSCAWWRRAETRTSCRHVSRHGDSFQEGEVREVGRDSMGVRGIKLRGDDKAISLDVVRDDADLSWSRTRDSASA